jgi:hypothetical protein
MLRKELQGDALCQCQVGGAMYLAHAAFAQQAHDAVSSAEKGPGTNRPSSGTLVVRGIAVVDLALPLAAATATVAIAQLQTEPSSTCLPHFLQVVVIRISTHYDQTASIEP